MHRHGRAHLEGDTDLKGLAHPPFILESWWCLSRGLSRIRFMFWKNGFRLLESRFLEKGQRVNTCTVRLGRRCQSMRGPGTKVSCEIVKRIYSEGTRRLAEEE